MNDWDDVPKHKKKARLHIPKKADHRHVYEPCVIEYPKLWYKKDHERNGERYSEIRCYCSVCGKIGHLNPERWWRLESCHSPQAGRMVPTEEALLELSPATRTLPTFLCDDYFAKYVDIEI